MPAIGIDLGTTFSCVAVVKNGQVEVMQNDRGNRITPSYVAFTETEQLVGDAAKDGATNNFKNTVFQSKRLMGRAYDDTNVQSDIATFPFEVIKGSDDKPIIKVTHRNATRELCPEEIGSMVLRSLQETAQAFLGEKIRDVVITVPHYFNDAQRTATKDAATIADLNVLRLINEPTAAAIAYGLDKANNDLKTILIFDLGGGTFDVTIAKVKDRNIDVLATGGDTHLGGEDFDNRMVEHFAREFLKKEGISIYKNPRAMSRLRKACEHSKRILSSATQENVIVDALCDGIDFKGVITRAKFDDLNSDLFDQTIDTVEKTLNEAGLKADEIDDVVLVGGSTRIIRIREMLGELFEDNKIRKTINPDEAVAYGAAAFAANLTNDVTNEIEQFTISDVTPLSLGFEVRGRDMCTVIKRNSKIPITNHSSPTTAFDNQTSVHFKIFEGERPATKDNHLLGSFVIDELPPQPKGVPTFDTKFHIDSNGILTVSAYHADTGQQKEITIAYGKERLSTTRIKRMQTAAEMFKKADDEYRAQSEARNKLEDFVYTVKKSGNSRTAKQTILESDRQTILKKCHETEKWLEYHSAAEKNEIECEHKKLKDLCSKYSLL
ncbi:heat shock 70 kDa protein cognate 4-like [Styela clava]